MEGLAFIRWNVGSRNVAPVLQTTQDICKTFVNVSDIINFCEDKNIIVKTMINFVINRCYSANFIKGIVNRIADRGDLCGIPSFNG